MGGVHSISWFSGTMKALSHIVNAKIYDTGEAYVAKDCHFIPKMERAKYPNIGPAAEIRIPGPLHMDIA